MVEIALDWKRIEWLPNETWKKDTAPKLVDCGLKLDDLQRSVYVIRLNGDYCVEYPLGTLPTLYIGEGNFAQRIGSHRVWVKELQEFVGEFSFQIRIAVPRVRKNPLAYRDCEAALLIRFGDNFGSAPLWNKQIERRLNPSYVYNQRQIDQAICKGSGTKYKWSFKPMRSSTFYSDFVRTHQQ